jgi:hypothetical protein
MNFSLPLAHIISKFILDGKEYDVDYFKIFFSQDIDYKGQPQHETMGGQLKIVLSQMADDNLYDWAKQSTKLKSGQIVFETEMSSPVLIVDFESAYCIELTRSIDAQKGTQTVLIISPETVIVNGVEHCKFWKT